MEVRSRAKDSKACAWNSSDIPIPLSSITVSIRQVSGASCFNSRKEILIFPPSGVYLMAFPTIFKNIWA